MSNISIVSTIVYQTCPRDQTGITLVMQSYDLIKHFDNLVGRLL